MSYKTNITEDIDGLQVRCDIMPYDVCGKIVSMSEDGCGLFSRNKLDVGVDVKMHVLVKNDKETCVVSGHINNIEKKSGHTDNVDENDNGWVYTISIVGEHDKWKDIVYQYIMSHK